MPDTAPHPSNNIPAPHLHLVYAAALRQTRDPHLAADITQAVFILLARRIHQGRPPKETHMAGWLLNVTRFAVKESRRAATRRAYHEKKSAQLHPESAAPSVTPDTDPITPHLDAALLALPATDRELLIRRYLQSQPVNELAATLRIPPNTAAKRISRALDRLRTLLHRRGILAPAALLTATLATQSLIRTPSAVASQILSAPTTATPLAKALSAKLLLAKLQITMLCTLAVLIPSLFALSIYHLSAHPAQAATAPPSVTTPVAATNPPAPPNPQLVQLHESLYQLRYCLIVDEPEKSYALIHDLTSRAKQDPTLVPELCAELDRATRDSEFRALAFTLRVINDPRAIPALIRAIPRVSVYSNDMGNDLNNQDLWNFLNENRLDKKYEQKFPSIDTPRAIRDIIAALQNMSGTSFGNAATKDAKNQKPESLDTAHDLRQAAADTWQDWWDHNKRRLLTPQQLASLEAPAPPGDPVEAAGLARFGPFFPVTPETRLSPVYDLLLQPQGRGDYRSYIDFDTGRTFRFLEGSNILRAGPSNYFTEWTEQVGVDAFVVAYVTNMSPTAKPLNRGPGSLVLFAGGTEGPPKYVYTLSVVGLRLWPIDDARWDTIDTELHNASQIPHGNKGPGTSFGAGDKFPLTFLFITREGGRGIVQLLNSSDNPLGVHIRYRRFETAIPATQPQLTSPAPAPPGLGFLAETAVVLHSPTSPDPAALDLGKGKTFAADPSILQYRGNRIAMSPHDWLVKNNADLIVQPEDGNQNLFALLCDDMAISSLSTAAWNTLTPADLIDILSHEAPRRTTDPSYRGPVFIMPTNETETPATWAFKTRCGATGLLQITASTPTTLTLHYKLLNLPAAPPEGPK